MEIVQFHLNFLLEELFHWGVVDSSWHFDTLEVADGLNVTMKVEKDLGRRRRWELYTGGKVDLILEAKLTLYWRQS